MPKDAAPEILPDLSTAKLFEVRGKIALITGGASGLGKMMSAALVQNGCRVYIASRRMDELERAAAMLNESAPKDSAFPKGTACIPLRADITSKDACYALAGEIKKREDHLDILVNNAGLTWGDKMTDFPEEKGWDKVFHLNVKSQFYLTVALLPLLEKGKSNTNHGSVLNISSVAAFSPSSTGPLSEEGSGTWSYQPSKAASVHLSRSLAVELAEKNILVNAICPGVFPSRMTAWGLGAHKDVFDSVQPTGRIGAPEDIGGLLLFLVSRAGAHITGAAIPIDGGQTLQFFARM